MRGPFRVEVAKLSNKLRAAFLAAVLLPGASVEAQPANRDPLPIARVDAVVQRHRSALNACYASARASRSDTPSHIDMTFIVGPDGRVTTVTFPLIASASALCFCVGRLIRRWSFPPFNNGYTVTVNYPFYFPIDS